MRSRGTPSPSLPPRGLRVADQAALAVLVPWHLRRPVTCPLQASERPAPPWPAVAQPSQREALDGWPRHTTHAAGIRDSMGIGFASHKPVANCCVCSAAPRPAARAARGAALAQEWPKPAKACPTATFPSRPSCCENCKLARGLRSNSKEVAIRVSGSPPPTKIHLACIPEMLNPRQFFSAQPNLQAFLFFPQSSGLRLIFTH